MLFFGLTRLAPLGPDQVGAAWARLGPLGPDQVGRHASPTSLIVCLLACFCRSCAFDRSVGCSCVFLFVCFIGFSVWWGVWVFVCLVVCSLAHPLIDFLCVRNQAIMSEPSMVLSCSFSCICTVC